MLKKYKLHSLQKHTERILSERDISQRNSRLKYLGFLVDETLCDDIEKLYDFAEDLGLQRKDIRIFSFIETRRKIPSLRQNQITDKEFGWTGTIHNENAKEFLNAPFDVLIGYYNGRHKFLDSLAAQSKAKFKIGFNAADERLFDLLLYADLQQTDSFQPEVVKYLRILKKI